MQVVKQHGISEQTLCVWRKRSGKTEATDVKKCWRSGSVIAGRCESDP